MAQGSQQFSSAKVLQAAQQAEASGNLDYAIQFYSHISDHHPASPEAPAAREGLARLAARQAGSEGFDDNPTTPHHTAPPTHVPGEQANAARHGTEPTQPPSQQYHHGHKNGIVVNDAAATASGTMPSNGANGAAQHSHAAFTASSPSAGPAGPFAPAYHPTRPDAVAEAESQPAIPAQFHRHLPASEDHYRLGRFTSKVIAFVGWLLVLLGLVGIVAAVVGVLNLADVAQIGMRAGMAIISLGMGLGMMLLGCVMIFSSQLARAVFDNANAVRDLAAIERARGRQPSAAAPAAP